MKMPPRNSFAVLTCGPVSLVTGKAEFFNIFENAGSDEICMFLLYNGRYMIVMGSGRSEQYKGWELGARPLMHHDQTGRLLSKTHTVVASGPVTPETLAKFKKATAVKLNKSVKGFGGKIYTEKTISSCSFGVFK